ncbi:hypothetical protein ACOSP7_020227 [Xanthoceras sorbifolium]
MLVVDIRLFFHFRSKISSYNISFFFSPSHRRCPPSLLSHSADRTAPALLPPALAPRPCDCAPAPLRPCPCPCACAQPLRQLRTAPSCPPPQPQPLARTLQKLIKKIILFLFDAYIGYHDNIEPDMEIRDEDLTHIVEDVDIPLYDGCSKYTKLSAIVVLYKHKATHGLSDKGFDELLDMMHIEKNICESLLGTLLNINGKTKDGVNYHSEKSTQDSGVSIEAETVCTITGRDGSQVTKKMVYYGVLRKILLVDYNQFRVPLFKCDWVSGNDVKVEDGFTLVNLHPRVNKYDKDPFILASQATQVFYSRETDTSNWYVVLIAPPRGFHDLEKFDEHAYMTSAPLDICYLIIYNLIILLPYYIIIIFQMSTEGRSDTPSSSSKRKGRGPNQINFNKIAKAKEVGVTFNELGQPLGDSSIALSMCIGTITTQMIPITYSSWPEVPDIVKNSVWETMKARFGLDDVGKNNVFNSMNTCWRQYKSRLTKRIRELSSGPEAGRMIQLLKPTNITDEDWSQFVSNRLSSEFDIISSKYSDLAKKNKAPHITSRKGLAQLREDLKQLEKISGNQATSISDDAVSQVLGKEHRGRVRGLGGGITPTRVIASVVGKQTITQLREEMKKQNKRHEDEMKRQQDEMNALKQQLKDLQSFVFNMQQQYSSASNLSGGNKCLNIAGTSAKSFSKASTSHMDGLSEKEKKCKLLHWMGNGEVVAEAEVDCKDPQAVVHGMILGPDCWSVSVKKILVSKVPLYRATTEFMTLEDTLNSFIAWPAKYVI